ncbi:MAG: arginine--tRNA ligase [Chlamydiia bacterium]|nr:arginine--tRNA ligase [Chlamydiia bacterium]
MHTFIYNIQFLKNTIHKLITNLFSDIDSTNVSVIHTKSESLGDYQTNAAFIISKQIDLPAKDIALKLCYEINKKISDFAFAESSDNGFISFRISEATLLCFLESINSTNAGNIPDKINICYPLTNKKRNIIVDYSSPNIAKPMHVGHLRSTIIGDSIANILEYCNQNVTRVNHIGDWGTQFGLIITYIKKNKIEINDISNNEQLLEIYQEANALRQDEEFMNMARREVISLQNYTPSSIEIWKKLCEISMNSFNEIYKILDISIKTYGESYYNNQLDDLAQILLKNKQAELSQGAICIFSKEIMGPDGRKLPFIIKKSDGGFGYASTDLAALRYRSRELGADWIIYVTDSGQNLHFKQLFLSAIACLDIENVKLDHVAFGAICNEDNKRIKTRSGSSKSLQSLIDECITTSSNMCKDQKHLSSLNEQEVKNISDILAIGALKYSDLSCNRTANYKFDFNRMFKVNGKSSIFINYTFVRIRKILLNSKYKISPRLSINFNYCSQYETSLIRHLFKYIDFIVQSIETLMPSVIASYTYELCKITNALLENCKVLGSDLELQRIELLTITSSIIKKSMELLGISLVNRM